METDQIREFYDRFAKEQAIMGVNDRHRKILSIALEHGAASASAILEVGCGIGTFTGLLARKIKKSDILAVDMSAVNIENARKHLSRARNVRLKVLDVVRDPIEEAFDLIVLPDVLEHIPPVHRPALFSKLALHLMEGGKVIIHSPDPDHLQHLTRTHPEKLQVVDIPLHLSTIIPEIEAAGLRLDHFQRHMIWNRVPDYMALILVHAPGDDDHVLLPMTRRSLSQRIWYRLISFVMGGR